MSILEMPPLYDDTMKLHLKRCGKHQRARLEEQLSEEAGEMISAIFRRRRGRINDNEIMNEMVDVLLDIRAWMDTVRFSQDDIRDALARKVQKWHDNETSGREPILVDQDS